jgi:opacity protein-like surface antigen
MKRVLIGVVSTVLLVTASGVARAEMGKAGVEVGAQMWINEWTHDVPGAGSITSDSTVLFGPAIKVKFPNHVFVDASYLFSLSDYTFSDNGTVFNDERQDANVAIGYMIVPEFGVLAGYKNSAFRERETGIEDTLYGPFIGMIGIAPVAMNASFYGKLNYLFTRFKENGAFGSFQEDSPGWTLEFGFKFDFTREFYGTFGYRYETNTGSNSNVQDSFSGLIFGAMFVF